MFLKNEEKRGFRIFNLRIDDFKMKNNNIMNKGCRYNSYIEVSQMKNDKITYKGFQFNSIQF